MTSNIKTCNEENYTGMKIWWGNWQQRRHSLPGKGLGEMIFMRDLNVGKEVDKWRSEDRWWPAGHSQCGQGMSGSLSWGQCDQSTVTEGPVSGKDVSKLAGMDGKGSGRLRGSRVRTPIWSACGENSCVGRRHEQWDTERATTCQEQDALHIWRSIEQHFGSPFFFDF